MTSPESMLAQLPALAAAITANAEEGRQLIEARNQLFVALKAAGVTQRRIAEAAGVTDMAVKKATDRLAARAG